MRYAVISDIHANIEALSAVLDAIDAIGVDAILCLGDIVGRFASPNECLDALRERKVKTISGNHDRATVGTKDMTYFGERAKRAILFTILCNQLDAVLRDDRKISGSTFCFRTDVDHQVAHLFFIVYCC